jgi:hypothetical protein
MGFNSRGVEAPKAINPAGFLPACGERPSAAEERDELAPL